MGYQSKYKNLRKLFYTSSEEDYISQVNSLLPVTLKYNADLIERVHARYPLLKKTEIALILTTFISVFRECLLRSHLMDFHNIFSVYIYAFDRYKNAIKEKFKGADPVIKFKVLTPRKLRKIHES